MGLLQNSFDAGTIGNAITAGVSGGANGDAFAVTGSGRTYHADAMHGAASAYFDLASAAAANYVAWTWTADDEYVGQFYFKLVSSVTATAPFFALRGSGASALQFTFNSSNQLVVLDFASGVKFTSAALTLGTWYRIDVSCLLAASPTSSNGTLKFDYYLGDGTTPVETGLNLTNVNLGTSLFDGARYGWTSAAATVRQMRIDSPRSQFAAGTTYLTPYGINTPPTVDAGANQNVAAGATVNLSASASDIDGTIVSHDWTYDFPTSGAPALSDDTVSNPSFTAGTAPNLYVLRDTVTDNDSDTGTDTVEVRVPGTGTLRPLAMDVAAGSVGTWAKMGGATTDGGALADESDTTGIESPTAISTEVTKRVRIAPSSAKSAAAITVRAKQDSAGTLVNKVRLYEGSTMRQEWTLTTTTSTANTTLTLDSGTVAAITDWGNLFLEFSTKV